ncbi:MAG: trypsin-like peptidase domain-containing protein [Planctomycetales bacterium]|nr:trypsin-like peptidase domain-containing protein [Planctomycetales bacterium]
MATVASIGVGVPQLMSTSSAQDPYRGNYPSPSVGTVEKSNDYGWTNEIGGGNLTGSPATASIESKSALGQSVPNQMHSLRPSIDPNPLGSDSIPSAESLDERREALFRELADEFNAFDRLGNLVRKVSQLVKPSVIHIEAHKSETKGGQYESYDEAGSGVVVETADGLWILTNRHVILGSQPAEILLRSSDGHQYHPTRILSDESTDVAVMKVPELRLPPARTGNSDQVNIGDFTIAIGSPFGLSHSVTFGILSAKGRSDLSLGDQKIDLQDFFQTDAAINPGNSGGPLLNLRGEVIGLNTAIASSSGGSEGIGFAIPINMVVKVADELIRHGRLRRGYLGVTLEPEFTASDLGPLRAVVSGGAKVKVVRRGSPAAKANLQRGDIIVEFNGSSVSNDDHLVTQVGLTPIGSVVPMIIYRDGKRYRTEVQLTDVN